MALIINNQSNLSLNDRFSVIMKKNYSIAVSANDTSSRWVAVSPQKPKKATKSSSTPKKAPGKAKTNK